MKGEMCSQEWKIQTRELLDLAWPAILEQLLLTTATYVDTAMIGVLGAEATAAVAVNSSVVFLIVGLLTAAGVGYSVQVAHSLGAREWERAGMVSTRPCWVHWQLGLPECFAWVLFPGRSRYGWVQMSLFKQTPAATCSSMPLACPFSRVWQFFLPCCAVREIQERRYCLMQARIYSMWG